MNSRPFPILGAADPPLVGREELMQSLWNDLTKATPSNLSVVGPRYIGKTVCLKALQGTAKQEASPYAVVAFWELGHAPPKSDDAFVAALCHLLREAMGGSQGDFADHRGYLRDGTYGSLKEVMDLLDADGHPVLMIWDGLDKPLGQGRLTGHLFGQLRDLFHGKRHKIVTAARATQSELARNKQVYDSEFWNLFDVSPIRVGPFHDADVNAALAVAGLSLSPGALKELHNWSGGFPLLTLALLNHVAAQEPLGQVENDSINRAAADALEEFGGVLTTVWEHDCTIGARDVYCLLVDRGEQPSTTVSKDDVNCLVSRGFALRTGNKVRISCRLLQNHVEARMSNTGSMKRLFGSWDSFRSEIRGVLELRLKQIPIVSNRLHRLVERSIEDIPRFPDDCLNNLTSIEEQALDLIWDHEFGTGKQIPDELIAYWTSPPRDKDRFIASMMNSDKWAVPPSRSDQLRLLQILTGSSIAFESRATHVSKDGYVLVNAIHSFRNRNQHADGQAIHESVAVAAVMICVELLGCLARELG